MGDILQPVTIILVRVNYRPTILRNVHLSVYVFDSQLYAWTHLCVI